MRKMTLLVLCTLAVQISHALTDKVDGILWYYTVADGVAKVGDGYVAAIPTSTTGSITIPSQLGGYAVDTINKFAFKDCTNLTSVIIPNSVNTMGSRLFKGCTNLVELTLPFIGNQRRDTSPTLHLGHLFTAGDLPLPNDDGLITIWETASSRYDFWVPPSLKSVTITDDTQLGVGNKFGLFKGCKYITNITLPASVATVGATTFADCIGLENIHLPAGITSVGSNAFHNCSGLKSVHIDDLSSWCRISFGEPHSNPLFYARNLYVGDKLATELVISNDVISIGNYAFYNCTNLTSVTIPDSVKEMGDLSFAYCTGLMNVIIPSGVTAMYRAFYGCTGLTSATISDGATSVGQAVFHSCLNLASVAIPQSVTCIDAHAFVFCRSLTNVTISGCITNIGDYAFAECTNLAYVVLSSEIDTLTVGVRSFDVSTEVAIADREGYVLYGWTNATGAVVADPFHSETVVTVSPRWRKVVGVTFNANGGAGVMDGQRTVAGAMLTLAENGFSRAGYHFLGWATSAEGDTAYADGATISNVPANMDGTIFYAVWKPHMLEIVPTEDAIFVHASETVTLSHYSGDVVILYTTDGSDPVVNGCEYKGAFAVCKSCRIRAVAYGAGRYSDEASVMLTRADNLGESANLYGYTMETDSAAPWTVDAAVSHDGVSSVRSGAIGNNGTTYLMASVKKAGTVSFWWKAQCEEPDEEDGEDGYYDYGAFLMDDVVKARIAGNDTGWQFVSAEVPTGGKHVLRWEYRKDGATSYAPDCVWVDQVQWIPADGSGFTLTSPEPVPYSWLRQYNLGVASGDFEAAANAASGKLNCGRPTEVWEEYVAGLDPTNANSQLKAMIEMQGDTPIVTWDPNLNTNGVVRTYKVYGSETLENGGEWQYPTNSLHRFFKVTVEMP